MQPILFIFLIWHIFWNMSNIEKLPVRCGVFVAGWEQLPVWKDFAYKRYDPSSHCWWDLDSQKIDKTLRLEKIKSRREDLDDKKSTCVYWRWEIHPTTRQRWRPYLFICGDLYCYRSQTQQAPAGISPPEKGQSWDLIFEWKWLNLAVHTQCQPGGDILRLQRSAALNIFRSALGVFFKYFLIDACLGATVNATGPNGAKLMVWANTLRSFMFSNNRRNNTRCTGSLL